MNLDKIYTVKCDTAQIKRIVVKTLRAFGCTLPSSLYKHNNPEDIDDKDPRFPHVVVHPNGSMDFTNNLTDGRTQTTLEKLLEIIVTPPKAPLVFPKPAKYRLVYNKIPDGQDTYTVSNPIEETENKITCYCFGKGIRSFIKAQICSFDKI